MSEKKIVKYPISKIFIIFIMLSFLVFVSACAKMSTAQQQGFNADSKTTMSSRANRQQEAIDNKNNVNQGTVPEQTTTTVREENSKEEGDVPLDYENDFILASPDGKKVALSDFVGKIVVLNFWATWCPPCKAEIPDFIEVYADFKDRDVVFFGVSLDDDINALKQFIFDFDIAYPVAIDNQIANVSGNWGISAIPTTFFIDVNGKILDKWIGQIPKKELENIIKGYLGRNKA